MLIKNLIKGTIAFALVFCVFSCSEDITIDEWSDVTPATFSAVIDGTAFDVSVVEESDDDSGDSVDFGGLGDLGDFDEFGDMFEDMLDDYEDLVTSGGGVMAYTTTIEYDFNDANNNVTEEGTYDAIRILGSDTTTSLALVFPSDIVEGTYNFSNTQGFYLANYLQIGGEGGTQTNRGKTGTLTITLHNQDSNYIEGYFAFETLENSITEGVFKTFYTVNN
ncbi:hypothetical protein [Neptunitalea lumnitzerae]|uniref:Uncharacterized protein n=1 Tax=Neptunitalea lumnitzerae TaxID=2965509 RepID=A0ABQ5MKY3_9FLAO|nr:hypothetical protein [Neptunitalea sp. Y10]GLB50065.1 hypothetical protein Y10_24330 [Neptunitalea sp. Y10]